MTRGGDAHEPSEDRRGAAGPEPVRPRSPRGDDDHRPVLPDRAGEDRPETWGERPDDDDDERYLRDRPPHW